MPPGPSGDAFHSRNAQAVLVEQHLSWEAMHNSKGHQASANLSNFESGALLEDCMLADTGGVVLAADWRM